MAGNEQTHSGSRFQIAGELQLNPWLGKVGLTFASMNRVFWLKIIALAGSFLLLLLILQSGWLQDVSSNAQGHFPDKVNLALRRTAHLLLQESGDTTSRIPAVEHTLSGTWLVRLERPFNYDRLPKLLQESLDLHEIHYNYDVAVLRCADNELALGYNFADYAETKEVPCGGRSMENDCYNLQVTFLLPKTLRDHASTWMLLGSALFGFFVVAWRWKRKKPTALPVSVENENTANVLRFGNSSLDVANLTLVSNQLCHKLTYREAKLLQVFASQPNQVLERDLLLKSVWEDEGIIVGRSLDVFVSRLRKLLREDVSLKIVAVHGMGYRLEVA